MNMLSRAMGRHEANLGYWVPGEIQIEGCSQEREAEHASPAGGHRPLQHVTAEVTAAAAPRVSTCPPSNCVWAH